MSSALLLALSLAQAGQRPLYAAATRLIDEHYLWVERLDAARATEEAAEAAEEAIPWLIATPVEGAISLRHGSEGEFARVPLPGPALAELPDALERLEDAILKEGTALPDDLELSVELLRGAARALDRPSVVLAGERLDRFDERIRGTTSGVGARVGLVDGELTVKSIFEGSPAERGGLRTGDVILRIDGVSTLGMPVSRAVERIRGPEDSEVRLVVRRAGTGGPAELELALVRAEMVLPNVRWEREGAVGVIAIDHFSDRTESLLLEALTELEAAGPLAGVVLDLRGNTGGSMIQAARTVDLFLQGGLVVRTAGRGGAPVDGLLHEIHARPGGDRLDLPLAVLIDDQSASASEIVAGALQAHGRALLLGDRSYGKGTVQKIYTLRGGEAPVRLKLTVAEYRLEGDLPVAEVGLTPDLFTQTAVFGRNGVSLPEPAAPGQRALVFVDERPGWREEVAVPERGDALRAFGIALVEGAEGADRPAMARALERALAAARAEEERRLVESFAARGVDWQSGGGAAPTAEAFSAGPPPVQVTLRFEDAPAPGARVRLLAEVRATGEAPLHRVRLRLSTEDEDLPWDDVILPIGALGPGEQRSGAATVAVPLGEARRQDQIEVRLEAEELPTLALAPLVAEIAGRAPPRLGARAALAPREDHQEVVVALTNHGPGALTGLRARLAWPELEGVELLAREAAEPALGAGETTTLRLPLRLGADAGAELPLELIVDAEQLVRPLTLPLALPRSGEPVEVAPPRLRVEAPLAALPGPLMVRVEAEDEQGLADLSLWQGGQKLAWAEGGGRQLRLEVPLTLAEGSTVIFARVHDLEGVETVERVLVRGLVEDGEASAEGEAP